MAVRLVSRLGEWDLPDGDLILGRHSTADLCIDDARLSRRHAELRVNDNQVSIADLGSVNGILVNGDRIAERTALNDGDLIVIGPLAFTIAIDHKTGANERLTAHRSGQAGALDAEFMPSTDRQSRDTVNMDPQLISALAPMNGESPIAHSGSEPKEQAPPASPPMATPSPKEAGSGSTNKIPTDQLLPEASHVTGTDALAPKDPEEALVQELRSIWWRRLLAAGLDLGMAWALGLLLALPIALGGLLWSLQHAGVQLQGERLVFGPEAEAAELIDLAIASLRPTTWSQLGEVILTLHADHRSDFTLFFVATTLALLALVLSLLFVLVAATMLHGAPFWHRRLGLVIREHRTGYYPTALRSVCRWLLSLPLAPFALLAIATAQRAPHDLLTGCRVCRRDFVASRN